MEIKFLKIGVCSKYFFISILILIFSVAPGLAQQVIIEVNDSESEKDDYLCWTPVPVRIKHSGQAENILKVVIRSKGNNNGGAVWFHLNNGQRPNKDNFSKAEEIEISLNTEWTRFWVAGRRPSIDKDVSVIVLNSSNGEIITNIPVMVRTRKNAETLKEEEIFRFLSALTKLHDLNNGGIESKFRKFQQSHREAFNIGIHGGPSGFPLFLAWHRAFLLNLERELQEIDQRVTIPYWRFDQPSSQLFTPDFIGFVAGPGTPGGFKVEFSNSNPLFGWRMNDGRGGIVRQRNGTDPVVAVDHLERLFSSPFNIDYSGINGSFEFTYHNGPHSRIAGWMASMDSPRDPLFFLLHANVDRAWAHWQALFDKFDSSGQLETVYSATGSYPGQADPDRFRKGSYALDKMWPWNGVIGDQGNNDPMDDWPGHSYPMPSGNGEFSPTNPPTPAAMVDYLDIDGSGGAHGSCYDDINFSGQKPSTN